MSRATHAEQRDEITTAPGPDVARVPGAALARLASGPGNQQFTRLVSDARPACGESQSARANPSPSSPAPIGRCAADPAGESARASDAEVECGLAQAARRRAPSRSMLLRNDREERPSDTLQDFVAMVRETSVQRMRRNGRALEAWDQLLSGQLTHSQLMGQVLAQETVDLFAEADRGGLQTQMLAGQWAHTSNPGMRYLQQEQIHGRLRACSGCHVSNLAWALEPDGSRRWNTPTEQLGSFAADAQGGWGGQGAGPAEAHDPLNPSTAGALAAVEAIRPFLEQLGPRGYKVLPEGVMNRDITPPELAAIIAENIDQRQADYEEFAARISSGDIKWYDLKPVVAELLPLASPTVRVQAREAIEDAERRRTIGDVIATIAKLALLLLIIFPPTSVLGIGIGAVAGGTLIGSGAANLERGLDHSLAIGAHDVLTPAQQAEGQALIQSGAMDIFAGVFAVGGAGLGAAARASAGSGSALTPAGGALGSGGLPRIAGTTTERAGWTVTVLADGSGAMATSPRYPGLVMWADETGGTIFASVGGRLQVVARQPWPGAATGGGPAAGAGGATESAMIPWRAPTGSQPPWLGQPPGFQALEGGPVPLRMGAGNATDRTLPQILNLRGPQRWSLTEDYTNQLYGGTPQVHRPVPMDPHGAYPVTTPGGRFTDASAAGGGGRTLAIEVKTYGRWRTVDGVAAQQRVPLTNSIREQIDKDIALRNADPSFDPRWFFSDAPPSPELQRYLADAGIVAIWTP